MHRQKILWEIEKDILQFQDTLETENNNSILEEKILDILGEIEAKVSQIISDKKGRNILQIEEVFQRYLNLHQIESNYTSIDDFLDILISKLSKELRERITQLGFDLFEKGNSKIEGIGDGKEKIEIKTSQKNKIFLRVLHKIGIQFENIQPFVETLNEKRMRKVPYQIYHIDSGEYKKTVLICDQIGQATFIYDSIIAPEIFQIIEKGEEIEGIKPLKIVYSQKSYENNLQIALDKKLSFEDKVRQVINEDEEKADQEKTKLTQQQLFEKLWNYEGRNEQESYTHFMSLGVKEINALEIGGNKVVSLKTLSGIEIEGKIDTPSVFQQWIDKVFEGKDIKTLKEQIFKQLWNYKGMSLQESYNHFMGLTYKGINNLEIGGNKILSLKTLSGIEIEGNIQSKSIFQEWIDKVFAGKDIEKVEQLTKQQLFEKLWNYEGRNQQGSYNHFMNFGAKEIRTLEIGGNKIVSLKKLSGIEIVGNIHTPSIFQQWIDKVFEGKVIQKLEQLTQQQLFEKLWNYEGRSEQESYNHFMNFSVKEISTLEIGGNKITSLKSLSGIEIEGKIDILSVFQQWIDKVFEGKDIEKVEQLTKQQLFEKLWNYEGRSEQESYNHFMNFSAKKIYALEIGGNKVLSLKTLSGIEIEGSIQIPSIFQKWIDKVFEGKDIQKVERLTKQQFFEKLWNYKGMSLQESYNHFMGLTQKGINNLEIGGNKILSLKTLSGIEVEGSITSPSIFQQWINKVFEGKDIQKVERLTKQQLFEKLWNYEGRSEQESYNHFMIFSVKEISTLEIGGNKITSLKSLSGIEIEGNIRQARVFQQWIEKVFEGKDIKKKN